MTLPFENMDACVVMQMHDKFAADRKRLEYKDGQGTTFAAMDKVVKISGLRGVMNLFSGAPNVWGELKDNEGNLLLTSTSHWGREMQERKVEIHAPDGTLLGILYDAEHGADFARPDGTIVGHARRPEDTKHTVSEVVHTYTDAAGRTVGTCDSRDAERDPSAAAGALELFNLVTGYGNSALYEGHHFQLVSATAPVAPVLHLHLFLFPALQHLRYISNS